MNNKNLGKKHYIMKCVIIRVFMCDFPYSEVNAYLNSNEKHQEITY